MTETSLKLTRRKFMLVSTAVIIASPLFLNLSGMVPEAKGAKKSKIYYITHECIGCQVCKAFCPADAIHFGDCRNEIDQDKCIHCGTCYKECPICVISETEV